MQTNDLVLQENDSIILNCTYQIDVNTDISIVKIIWEKQFDVFKDIAIFLTSGDQKSFIEKNMRDLYINRTCLIAPTTSLSAVMIINDSVCSDVGKYRCRIEYYADGLGRNQTSVSVVYFNGKLMHLICSNIDFLFTLNNMSTCIF